MREEVGYREIPGEAESVDNEASFGDEFVAGEICGNWRERRAGGEERNGGRRGGWCLGGEGVVGFEK